MEWTNTPPNLIRQAIREQKLIAPTSGMAKGYIQANVVILPQTYAYDFLLFCQRNPKTCPLLDVSDVGKPSFPKYAPQGDIRNEVGLYFVYKRGKLVEKPYDISDLYDEKMVSFLIGCSFTFEHAMLEAGLPVRHIEENHNVPMYITNIPTLPAGIFHGATTVSMRPMTMAQAIKATEITSNFKATHGAPIHIGNPEYIGIKDISSPDFGEASTIRAGEIPVFWGCGVTPQSVCLSAKPELMITHAPGFMFITDIKDSEILY